MIKKINDFKQFLDNGGKAYWGLYTICSLFLFALGIFIFGKSLASCIAQAMYSFSTIYFSQVAMSLLGILILLISSAMITLLVKKVLDVVKKNEG